MNILHSTRIGGYVTALVSSTGSNPTTAELLVHLSDSGITDVFLIIDRKTTVVPYSGTRIHLLICSCQLTPEEKVVLTL